MRSEPDQIPQALSDKASQIYSPPGSGGVRRLLFPLFVFLASVVIGRKAETIYTLQGAEAVVPSILLKLVLGTKWILLAPDVPEGRYSVVKNHVGGEKYSIRGAYHRLRFEIELFAGEHADVRVYSDLSGYVDFDKPKNILLKGGVDCNGVEEKNECSADNNDPVRIIYVGSMYYHRGIDIVLDAMQQVNHEVELSLVGPTPDAAARPENFNESLDKPFVQMVDESQRVEYLGELSHEDVFRELHRADIGLCLLPYKRGLNNFKYAYPIKIFEYMLTYNAVIATETVPTSDLLDESQLLTENSPALLAERIDDISGSETTIQRLKSDNFTRVQDHCWDALKSDLDQELSELLT
ncbi:glycosyltransferase [Haloarcula sp. 1CSR25-25]|uniref:glycosyltransferase n=1 Tax=Haloarcula sp. 1CSR25-25 TaxID=2862545 RepID=UPI002894BA59|nr:glycosyltransferase [Haloarcula sp. 1CSR25-25]MDT3434232.1 glycosyltransferase [Haloarcula sp. 1CSR25-25]